MAVEAGTEAAELDGQLTLLTPPGLAHDPAAHLLDLAGEHGEVFTRPWVVELILDLVGYTSDRDLAALVAVEPACGSGAFLGPLVTRLSASCRLRERPITDASGALRAFDLLPANVAKTRDLVIQTLVADAWPIEDIEAVAARWVQVGDYLLRQTQVGTADVVISNPPYVRLDDVPDARMRAYRRAQRSRLRHSRRPRCPTGSPATSRGRPAARPAWR